MFSLPLLCGSQPVDGGSMFFSRKILVESMGKNPAKLPDGTFRFPNGQTRLKHASHLNKFL